MKKKRNKPQPILPAPLAPDEHCGWVGERELNLIWNVFDSLNGYYKQKAWLVRLPEYIGMFRFFASTDAPWSLVKKFFTGKSEFTNIKLGQRPGGYLESIAETLLSYNDQHLGARGVKGLDRFEMPRIRIPEPLTLYHFVRALQALGIPKAREFQFVTSIETDGGLHPQEGPVSCARTYQVARMRVPVEEIDLSPTWEQAKAFADLRKRKTREAGEPNCTTRQPAGRPRIDSLSEAVMSHSWRKSEKEGFKDLIARFCKDIPPSTDDRDTLIELFSYQQLALAIQTVEDFTALIAANESLPPEEKASSAEIWAKWNWAWRVESSMMLREIGRKVTSAVRELAALKHSSREST